MNAILDRSSRRGSQTSSLLNSLCRAAHVERLGFYCPLFQSSSLFVLQMPNVHYDFEMRCFSLDRRSTYGSALNRFFLPRHIEVSFTEFTLPLEFLAGPRMVQTVNSIAQNSGCFCLSEVLLSGGRVFAIFVSKILTFNAHRLCALSRVHTTVPTSQLWRGVTRLDCGRR